MNKDDLAQLLKNIEENEKIINAEIPPVQFAEVTIYQRLKANALDATLAAKAKYHEYISNHIGGIILKGTYDKQLQFADLAQKIGKTITFDSTALYRKLSDVGFNMMGGKGGLTADQIALVFTEIRLLTKSDLGMFRVRDPDVNWMFNYVWNDPQKFSDAFRMSLFYSNGLRITYTACLKQVFEESLREPIARTTVPVVFVGMLECEEAELHSTLTHGYIDVDLTGCEINEEFVTNAFVQLKDTIKARAAGKENNQ